MNDSKTNAGQIALQVARDGMRAFEKELNKKMKTIIAESDSLTPQPDSTQREAVIDGMVQQMGEGYDEGVFMIKSFIECRARFMSEKKLTKYGNTLMFTADKMERCRDLTKKMAKEFWYLNVITVDSIYYVFRLTDRDGNWMMPFEARNVSVLKDINSTEKVLRDETVLDIKYARKFKL